MLSSYFRKLARVQRKEEVSIRFSEREANLLLYITKSSSLTQLFKNCVQAVGVCLPVYQDAALKTVKDVLSLMAASRRSSNQS